jgi:hypothetical protein
MARLKDSPPVDAGLFGLWGNALKLYVEEYRLGAGSEEDNYHPNEIAADRFSELAVMDELIDKKDLPPDPAAMAQLEARLKPTRDWAKKAFAKPAVKL